MNTPELDKIANRVDGDKVNRWTNVTQSGILGANVLVCFFAMCGIIYKIRNNDEMRTIMSTNEYSSAGVWAVFLLAYLVFDSKKEKNEKSRKLFASFISNAFADKVNPYNDEYAKMAAEYLLNFMTGAEKDAIKVGYEKLNTEDTKAVDAYIARVNEIITGVLVRQPGLDKTVADIASGKTYAFNGWAAPERGGR
ncbi:MAG: hypothetical protein J6T57_02865 [Alphaproteobacteria bacterium]|nr:hypothetical protein [Alphaproteobacteria bacterium]